MEAVAAGFVRSGRVGLCLVALALSLVACGPPPVPGPVTPMDPLHAVARDGRVTVQTAEELLAEANALYGRGRFAEAAAVYERLIAGAPPAETLGAALFNAGLAYEGLRDPTTALARYEALVALGPEPRRLLDVRFRMAGCEEALGRWPEAAVRWDAVLAMELTVPDRIDALARRGVAREHEERLPEAEEDFRAVLALYRAHADEPRVRELASASIAQYHIGEIYRGLFERITFALPVERMGRDLAEKTTLFLKAQRAYLDTVRLPSEYWALAAGFQLGQIVERMYADLLAAEVPPAFTAEERRIYEAELRRAIRPYLERAIEIYETNLSICERVGHEGDWASRTREGLVRLQALLREERTE